MRDSGESSCYQSFMERLGSFAAFHETRAHAIATSISEREQTTGIGQVFIATMEKTMTNLKRLGAAALMAVTLPLAAASPSFAAGRGYGPCTPAAGVAVGAAGPAMNSGQLAAGVGQCQRIGSQQPYGAWGAGNTYGYRQSNWGAPPYAPYGEDY